MILNPLKHLNFDFFSSQNLGVIFASHKHVPFFVTDRHGWPQALILCQNDNVFQKIFLPKPGYDFRVAQTSAVFRDRSISTVGCE